MAIQVGQTMYLKPINNASRRNNREIKVSKITKVGRVYYEIDGYGKFELDNNFQYCGEYSSNYIAYQSRKEIEDEWEAEKLSDEIANHFNVFNRKNHSLETLKKIKAILNNP